MLDKLHSRPPNITRQVIKCRRASANVTALTAIQIKAEMLVVLLTSFPATTSVVLHVLQVLVSIQEQYQMFGSNERTNLLNTMTS